MKVWKMKDLGLQAVKLISSASIQGSAAEAMDKFAELVHNFPKMANMVSSTKVPRSLRNEVRCRDNLYMLCILVVVAAAVGSVDRIAYCELRQVTSLYTSGAFSSMPLNSLFINGKRTDLGGNTFNLFDLLLEVQ